MTIWKYQLHLRPQVQIKMSRGAQILCVQVQDNIPFLWAMVDPEQATVERRFDIIQTGQRMGLARLYIGTFQLKQNGFAPLFQGGNLVFHVFEDQR